jgi:hypothetical protein
MKKLIWLIVIVAVVAGVWYLMSQKAPTGTDTTAQQDAQQISAEASAMSNLSGLDDASLNAEFKQIDADSKSL